MTTPQYHNDLIALYTVFRDQVYKARSVLHPSCANDASPSKVFDAVTYVDLDTIAMDMFRQHGLDAQGQDIREYRPTKEHDVLILLNPAIATEWASRHLKKGGYVVTNNYHGNATGMHKRPDAFELIGTLDFVEKDRRKDDMRVVYSQHLEGLFVPVQDFDELKKLRPDAHDFLLHAYGGMWRQMDIQGTVEEKYLQTQELMGNEKVLPAKRVAERYVFVKK